MRIVVSEYPRSGGSWVVSMLGDALSLPKRDIYVDDNYKSKSLDVRKHPWYVEAPHLGLTESCVIKSHEPPSSSLVGFPARFIHLVRDGRDVIVSKFFYEKDFCVQNGIYERFDVSFDEYVPRVAIEWREYVLSWLDKHSITCRYENFLQDPCAAVTNVLTGLGMTVPHSQISHAVEANTKDNFRRALDKINRHNTFIRRGIAGDWRNHFNNKHIEIVKEIAGDALILFGYEQDLCW